jgi:hypothetical protein
VILSLLVYVSDVFVLGTYGLLAIMHERAERWFHWANALGGAPTILFELHARAYPVMPLTVTFCVLGWVGVWRTRGRKH